MLRSRSRACASLGHAASHKLSEVWLCRYPIRRLGVQGQDPKRRMPCSSALVTAAVRSSTPSLP
jgi:hypothetical protein